MLNGSVRINYDIAGGQPKMIFVEWGRMGGSLANACQ